MCGKVEKKTNKKVKKQSCLNLLKYLVNGEVE